MVSLPAASDFSFDSRNNFQYDSAPESPRGFNNYFFSVLTIPNHQISFSFIPDQHLKYDHHRGFDKKYDENKPFVFNPSDHIDSVLVSSADELFEGGKIKPLEPEHKNIIQSSLSFGRNNKFGSELFTIGKDHVEDSSSSPKSKFSWLHKKWKLKDLLFRNASEGHETKYDFLRKIKNDDLKNLSTSTSSIPSTNNRNKEKAPLSAHARHYRVNRAATKELKRKTYLSYKQNRTICCMNIDAASVRDPSRATLKI